MTRRLLVSHNIENWAMQPFQARPKPKGTMAMHLILGTWSRMRPLLLTLTLIEICFNSPLLFWILLGRFFEFAPAILNSAVKIFWIPPPAILNSTVEIFWICPRYFEFRCKDFLNAPKIFWMPSEFYHGDLNLPLLFCILLQIFFECPLLLFWIPLWRFFEFAPTTLNSAAEIFSMPPPPPPYFEFCCGDF